MITSIACEKFYNKGLIQKLRNAKLLIINILPPLLRNKGLQYVNTQKFYVT